MRDSNPHDHESKVALEEKDTILRLRPGEITIEVPEGMCHGMTPVERLTTLAEFKKMCPWSQGYISYMEGDRPGSELKRHQTNPYNRGSANFKEFQSGQQSGVLEAQDGDE